MTTANHSMKLPAPFADFNDLMTILPAGSQSAVDQVRAREAQLTKPAGSLGQLEYLVEFLARWQDTAQPSMANPMVAIFAGNHGVTAQGISAYPAEVTAQMVANFTNGGAAISQICAQHELNLRVFELALEIPTGDITVEPALDDKACAATMAYGMEAIVGQPDLLCVGEMGIGNTTIAAAIFAALFGGTGTDWVGAGTGVDQAGLARKAKAVDTALALHKAELTHPLQILARVGGREFAAMLGAIVAARHHNIPVRVDGVGQSVGELPLRVFAFGLVLVVPMFVILAGPFVGLVGVGMALVVAVVIIWSWTRLCHNLVGGYTGDLIGGLQALLEIGLLSVLILFV